MTAFDTLVGTLVVLGTLLRTDGFFMGTKHTTPPTQLPMHNHNGKTYAKVGDQYVEYDDNEMYYDRHDKMKNQAELDKDFTCAEPMSVSNSETRKEERRRAEQAWKQARRDEVSDVTGMPMYEGETYNQYGQMDYGKEPEAYGGQPLGGREVQYEDRKMDRRRGPPPLNPYGPQHPQYGGGELDRLAGLMNPGGMMNPGGDMNRRYFPHYEEAPPMQRIDEDFAKYIGNPMPQGILTLSPLSDERPVSKVTAPHTTQQLTEELPTGMWKNISAADFEKYHGPDGNLNLMGYERNRRIMELNERRAAYAMELARKASHPEFDGWVPPHPEPTTPSTSTTRKKTTEFVPQANVTLPDYICNFR